MTRQSQQALIVIDLQNDYFPGGAFPLWAADETLEQTLKAIKQAQQLGQPVLLVQHVADPSKGPAPFFNTNTPGVDLHPAVLAAAPDSPHIIKHYADAFYQTNLSDTLNALGVTEIVLCGMMTQNCVTHTALSKAAEQYQVSILSDCCTTVSDILHRIALSALAPRLSKNDKKTKK